MRLPILLRSFVLSCAFFTAKSTDAESYKPLPMQVLPLFHFYNNKPIRFKSDQAYDIVVKKWTKKLSDGFDKFFKLLYQDTGSTSFELLEQLTNQNLLEKYHALQDTYMLTCNSDNCLNENEAPKKVVSFIKLQINKLTTQRNYKIFLIKDASFLTITYGSHERGHTILCNADLYSIANIESYYRSLVSDAYSIYGEQINYSSARFITTGNLLNQGLATAAVDITQQANLLSFILNRCTFAGKKPSKTTINLYSQLNAYESFVFATLHSNNPLENALFLSLRPNQTRLDKKLSNLLVKDLSNSYHETSLSFFNSYIKRLNNNF